MKNGGRKFHDGRVWLLIPLCGFLVSAAWVSWKISSLPPRELNLVVNSEKFSTDDLPLLPTRSAGTWNPPAPQTRGKEWIFDLFTPPEIYFDDGTKHFSVIPPTTRRVDVPLAAVDFGAELVRLERSLFRLQLVGFVGDESNPVGTFENVMTTEHFLARAGRKVTALGLTIAEFALEKNPLEKDSGDAPASEWIAVAKVRDELSGKETVLSSRERNLSGPWLARIKFPGDSDEGRLLSEGESVRSDESNFLVREIRGEANSVLMTKKPLEGGASETLTLAASIQP